MQFYAHIVYSIPFVPTHSDLLVARYMVNNSPVNQFHDTFLLTSHAALHQGTLSVNEYRTLTGLLGTEHLSSVHFHSVFLDVLNEPERNNQEARVLLKILGQGFMNVIPPLPFCADMKANILSEEIHHCVRCHENYLIRNNGRRACVLPGGSTVRHTTSVEDVTGYGVHFARCIGEPQDCAVLAAMTHPRDPFRGGRRGAMY